MKVALITGITGQDGSYLAELLLEKGYMVHGFIRRSSSFNTQRIDNIFDNKYLKLHYSDLSDPLSISTLLSQIKPNEIYNLGAQSHVGVSFLEPDYTADVVALGTLRLLEAIRIHKIDIKFYQASSSELFGKVQAIPQTEDTPFYPRSPYAVSKLFAYWIVRNYRESYNLFASNGILFNHESPRRGETFVTRKIVRGLCKISLGLLDCLYLGNLDAKRDWGYAPDFVDGMWKILQEDTADDFILATGELHSVRECVSLTAKFLGMDISFEGSGLSEQAIDKKANRAVVKVDKKYFRPAEVDLLVGDYSKAKRVLGWQPKVLFSELIEIMVKTELKALRVLRTFK